MEEWDEAKKLLNEQKFEHVKDAMNGVYDVLWAQFGKDLDYLEAPVDIVALDTSNKPIADFKMFYADNLGFENWEMDFEMPDEQKEPIQERMRQKAPEWICNPITVHVTYPQDSPYVEGDVYVGNKADIDKLEDFSEAFYGDRKAWQSYDRIEDIDRSTI